MAKLKYIICVFLFFFAFSSVDAIELDIYSEHAILYNLDENRVLFEKNAEEEVAIASLTKMVTALVTIENIVDLNQKVTLVSSDFAGLYEANASMAGFFLGEEVTVLDLLYGLLLPSGAEASLALTRIVAGGKDAFVEKMNALAQNLGLSHTHFKNATGLDEEGHYSTVMDVAKIFQYALQNETFSKIIQTPEYRTSNNRLKFTSSVKKAKDRNHLSMDYLVGGKTGTTENAGLCLASIAYANGIHYLLVTVKAPNNWVTPTHLLDAKKIYEYFINNFSNQELAKEGEKILSLKTKDVKEENVDFYLDETIIKYLPNDFNLLDVEYRYDGLEVLDYHVTSGTKLGVLDILYQGEHIKTIDIVLKSSLAFSLSTFLQNRPYLIWIGGIFLVIVVTFFFIIQKRRRHQ